MIVSRETSFQRYVDLLIRWSATLNLSSTSTADAAGFNVHVKDSLTIVRHLPHSLTRLIDLGSGQGFPAIPIAIETGVAIDMIEADRRKAAFLTTCIATLGLKGRVLRGRIEQADAEPAYCVTARALAPLTTLIKMARPLVLPGGCCLFLKGPAVKDEVAEALRTDAFDVTVTPTGSAGSNLVKITGLR